MASRQRSSSALSNQSDSVARTSSPARRGEPTNLRRPGDAVPEDGQVSRGHTPATLNIPLQSGSPYPSISATPASPSRPRASTADIASASQAKAQTRGFPRNQIPLEYQQGQRYPSTPLSVESSRPQYIPPPPPPPQNTMILPPPPPRPPTSNGPANMVPPPPPGPPPSVTNIPAQWSQQGWGRQQTYLPPPPPLGPNQMNNKQAQYLNHPAFQNQRPGLAIPGPPHSESHVPLSATYIPGGESFGPGVGIPPLYTQQEQEPSLARDDSFSYTHLDVNLLADQKFFNGPSSAISPHKDLPSFMEHANGSVPQTPQSKGSGDPSPVPGQKRVEPLTALPTHGRSISAGLLSPNDPARDWTLERVLKWLEANKFSTEWQETFGSLNIHGKDFLGLGRANGGRGNFGMMHERVYPRLARVCAMSSGWHQDKEREEGRRLRRLVREIAESADAARHARHESEALGSASTNGGVETSPSPSHLEVFTQTPSTAGGGEESPGRQFKPPLPTPRTGSKVRSSTVPTVYSDTNETRSGLTRGILRDINEAVSRRSPSEHTTFIGDAIRNTHNGSPQSGSPIPSPSTLGPRHRKNESGDSLNDKRRNGHEIRPDHGRQNSNETPSSAKELSKGFLDRFRRRKREEPHEDDESPTSPEYARIPPPTLLSLQRDSSPSAERPTSASRKKYILVTPDQWNFRLVDITEAETSAALRSVICKAVNYADHEIDQAFLYLTEPGQVDHDDPLSDASLMLTQRAKADSFGTLKIYVRRALHSGSLMPPQLGLGIGMSPKASPPAGSLFPRKALDERPVSPRPGSMKDQVGKIHAAWESGTLTEDQWGSWLQSAIEEYRKENPVKSDRTVNFDVPRKSPYDKEPLMPTRKPPAPPINGSQMLEKANSLTRKSGDSIRSSIASQSSLRRSIDDTPANSPGKLVGSRRNMPHLNTAVASPQRKFMSQEALTRKISAAARPRSQGPAYSFQESEVSFDKKLPQASDDSDDGLFAKPLKKANDVSRRPTLTVNTDASRKSKGLSVSFNTEDQPPKRRFEKRTPDTDDPSSYSESPDKFARRQSFMRDDMWANRPATEDLLNNLDAFFPNLDLDEPVVEDLVSPTSPPTQIRSSLYDRVRPESIAEEPDTLGSEDSTLKSRAPIDNRKSVRRSVGLGRMKSIRDVARGAHDSSKRNTRVSMLPALPEKRNSEILRRKSTKMFGANIVQLKPGRGSRVSLIEAVPKDIDTANSFQIARGQLIGKGSYGKVYLGINLTTGEFLAVKQVQVNQRAAGNDKAKMKEMVQALDQEIDTMQHLEHPNIVAYLGCERKELSISIFLEYISGGSVGSCLRKHGKFDEPLVSSLTRQTLDGLAYLHQEGVLHRDLKADNILLDVSGTCKISDFGISKKSDNIYGNDATNNMQGSVFWMAPEVVRSQGQGYSAKVDIWSLGCVVLEMFTGKRPWSKDEVIGAIYKLGTKGEAPPIPEEVTNSISAQAYGFLLDCFTIDPSERPTAGTLLRHQFVNSEEAFDFSVTELAQKLHIEGMQ